MLSLILHLVLATIMKPKFLIISVLSIVIGLSSCDSFETRSMNQPSRSLEELKTLALDSGDIDAYNELETAYLDYEHGSFFDYAKQMADKHNYPQAFYDTYIQLLKHTDAPGTTLSLDSCDENTRKMAMKYLQKAYDLGFEPAKEELEMVYQKYQRTNKLESDFFVFDEQFDLVTFNKNNKYPSSDTDTSKCNSWIIDDKNLKQIIAESRFIEGQEWHYLFSHLPCQYEGQLKQKNLTYKFTMNSGAWGTIERNDSIRYYGVFGEQFDKYFLTAVWREEDEN